MYCPSFRYEECYSEHGGSHCGGGGTKSSLRGHATGRLLLWQVPESPAPVSRSCGHHPAQEHVYCASGHSAGKHVTNVIGKANIGSLFVLSLIAVFPVSSSRASLNLSFLKRICMIFEQWRHCCIDIILIFCILAAVHGVGARDVGHWNHRPGLFCSGGWRAAVNLHPDSHLLLLTRLLISSWR